MERTHIHRSLCYVDMDLKCRIFGGQKPYIECVTQLYLIILAQTLEDGYMGTEENILAIALRRYASQRK